MSKKLLLLVLLPFFVACRSTLKVPENAQDAYYQQQISPAGGSQSLYFYLPLPTAEANLSIDEVYLNDIAVPFKITDQGPALEIYLQKHTSETPEEDATLQKKYLPLFKAEKYSALIRSDKKEWSYPNIRHLINQTLPN